LIRPCREVLSDLCSVEAVEPDVDLRAVPEHGERIAVGDTDHARCELGGRVVVPAKSATSRTTLKRAEIIKIALGVLGPASVNAAPAGGVKGLPARLYPTARNRQSSRPGTPG
jgi:hypothetical protein